MVAFCGLHRLHVATRKGMWFDHSGIMATIRVVYATSIMLLVILAFRTAAGRFTMEVFKKFVATGVELCVASNINIQHAETLGVGIPIFTV